MTPAGITSPQFALKVSERFRRLAMVLILASTLTAIGLAIGFGVQINLEGTSASAWLIASLLLVSRIWWLQGGHRRIADAFGTVSVAALGGMTCGAIAMLELRLNMPIADGALNHADHLLGIDAIAILEALVRQGHWLFAILAPSYNYTLQIFFAGLVALSLIGERVEAWRASLCFVGTLLTTCMIAALVPAKGIATWASAELIAQLPLHAMRNFWPHFDEFYFSAHPVLRVQVVDGVIAFPSFHAITGFLTVAMWRKRLWTVVPALVWLFFMLLATFPGGGHYAVDLIGGFLVWAAWFAATRRIEQRSASEAIRGKIDGPDQRLVAGDGESVGHSSDEVADRP